MTDKDDIEEQLDEEELTYLCGDCGEAREKEDVEFVEHDNPKLGEYPICTDKSCSIEGVDDPTTSEFKVDEKLE